MTTPTETILDLEKALEAGPLPWADAREKSTIDMNVEDWMQDEIDGLRRIVDFVPALLDAHASALRALQRIALIEIDRDASDPDEMIERGLAAVGYARSALDDNTKGAMSHG